jgi:uncharacterized protein (TIRG00374 family)
MDNQVVSERRQWIERRHVIQLILVAAIVFLLIPHFVGADRIVDALRHANLGFVVIAIFAEVIRYFASAASTRALARMFQRDVPLSSLVQAFFAGAATNRTFSTGGAPGMLVRLLCLRHYGVATGSVAALFLIENINGFAISIPTLIIGIVLFVTKRANLPSELNLNVLPISGVAIVAALAYLYTRRTWVERTALFTARAINRLARLVLRRSVFHSERVLVWVGDFYTGMSLAARNPAPVALSLLMNFVRNTSGLFALYFTFMAVGAPLSFDILILVYTAASFLTTVSAAPGEVAIMGSGMLLLSHAAGVPQAIAVTAMLISRGLAFWLPLPIGYAALWNLMRRGEL